MEVSSGYDVSRSRKHEGIVSRRVHLDLDNTPRVCQRVATGSVDLGHAPVTDQQGIAGLTGKVDQHFWRLFGAVFIGGALRGGTQALQVGLTQAGSLGPVASGVGGTANQATQQRLGRALDTRPTITVDSGQLCQVLLTKPLTLAALWQ